MPCQLTNANAKLIPSNAIKHWSSLNVSDLEAPKPMQAILLALQKLSEHDGLRVKHRREPFPLYSLLQQQGFSYSVEACEESYLLFIWKPVIQASHTSVEQEIQ